MNILINRMIQHAFLSGFVAAREIPAHEEAVGVKKLAEYKPVPSTLESLNELEASMINNDKGTISKASSRYPYTYACDWIREAGIADSRAEASQWLQNRADQLGETHYDISKKAADEYIAHHGRIEAIERQSEQKRAEWTKDLTPAPEAQEMGM